MVLFAETGGVIEVRYQNTDENANVRMINVSTVIFGLAGRTGVPGDPDPAGFSM
jgi:hypothetical protein